MSRSVRLVPRRPWQIVGIEVNAVVILVGVLVFQ